MKKIGMLAVLALMAALTLTPVTRSLAAACTTVVVTDANPSAWAFQVTSADGIGEYREPAPHTLGQGSAYLFTGTDGSESAQLRNTAYSGTKLNSLTSLGYCTYVLQWNTGASPGQVPYIILNVDADGNGTVDDLLFFEPLYSDGSYNPSIPAQAEPALNTWQCWDAFNGGWYSINGVNGSGPGTGVQKLSDIIAAYPNGGADAQIVNSATGLGGVRIVSGFASPSDVFESYVDAFQIGTAAGCKTFDFEKFDAPTNAEQCKKGGWQTFAPPAGPFKNQGQCIQYVNTGK